MNRADFRFPREYSDEWQGAPFVRGGKIFYTVPKDRIKAMNQIAEKTLTFLSQFKGKKFRGLNNLCCRLNYHSLAGVIKNTKIVAVWRDPRSQYKQVIRRTNKDNIQV